jgi:hydrogenase maturation protease
MTSTPSGLLVVGLGNSWAGDDAAGVLVARELRERLPQGVALMEHEGEPTALIDAWSGRRLAIVVDATSGAGAPGAISCFDATTSPLPSGFKASSTHAFSLVEAIELARSLGRLPGRLIVVGVEGQSFAAGAEPSPAAAAGIESACTQVLELLRAND